MMTTTLVRMVCFTFLFTSKCVFSCFRRGQSASQDVLSTFVQSYFPNTWTTFDQVETSVRKASWDCEHLISKSWTIEFCAPWWLDGWGGPAPCWVLEHSGIREDSGGLITQAHLAPNSFSFMIKITISSPSSSGGLTTQTNLVPHQDPNHHITFHPLILTISWFS